MTAPAPSSGHSLRVMFEPDSAAARLSLVCHETSRAACRLTCPVGCETWNQHNHAHELIEVDECNAVLWIGDDGDEYCAFENEAPFALCDGMPVTVTWAGDTHVWAPVSTTPRYDPAIRGPARHEYNT